MPLTYNHPPAPSKASLVRWWKSFTHRDGTNGKGRSHDFDDDDDESDDDDDVDRSRGAGDSSGRKRGRRRRSSPNSRRARAIRDAAVRYQPPSRGLAKGAPSEGRVFGVSPDISLAYASVAISMLGPDQRPYVYGYVPVVVAKCGMFLKTTATQVQGIFRVSGSSRRINELQKLFDEPPRYGKDLDWTGYTQHDAASVLRRYLNMMPEPVIPQNLYLDFVNVLQRNLPLPEAIAQYRTLIGLLPATSRYLLLYLLDFLSVFAHASEHNLMTASNLAVVFQPGLVSTRSEGATPGALLGFPGFQPGQKNAPMAGHAASAAAAQEGVGEHGRGKEVLEFLIEQQANFVMGLEPPVPAEVASVEVVLKNAARAREEHAKQVESATAALQAGSSAASVHRLTQATGPAGSVAYKSADLARRGSEKSVERRKSHKDRERHRAAAAAAASAQTETMPKPARTQESSGEQPTVVEPTQTSASGATVRRSRTLPSRKSTDSKQTASGGSPAAPRGEWSNRSHRSVSPGETGLSTGSPMLGSSGGAGAKLSPAAAAAPRMRKGASNESRNSSTAGAHSVSTASAGAHSNKRRLSAETGEPRTRRSADIAR